MSTIEKALGKKKLQGEAEAVTTEPVAQDVPHHSDPMTYELDLDYLSDEGLALDNGVRTLVTEEYRAIKRKLLSNAFGAASGSHKRGNLIFVSSANPHEGKTYTAVNLALSIASEKDKTVLLVDADVLKPSICGVLGVDSREGLIEYLLGEKQNIGDVMYSTNIPKLKVIPAGNPHHLSNELLASSRMTELAEELASRYSDRVVIFDSPPLLGVNETVVLANLMGQAVIVVEEDKTRIADIKAAVSQLQEELAIGFVVNKSVRTHSKGYGYGYGYYGSNKN